MVAAADAAGGLPADIRLFDVEVRVVAAVFGWYDPGDDTGTATASDAGA